MGFRNTKPPSACSAIVCNEKILLFDTDINIRNSLHDKELEVKVRKKLKITTRYTRTTSSTGKVGNVGLLARQISADFYLLALVCVRRLR
jgi:hypothetical protein